MFARLKTGILLVILLLGSACQRLPDNAAANQIRRPNKTAAKYNVRLGIAYLAQKQTVRSKEKLMLALQQAPDWAPALDAMAYYFETIGDLPEAKQFYLKALAIAPNAGSTNNNYGTFLCRQKAYQKAISRFERAVADPKYIHSAKAFENAALCAERIPDQALALSYFKKTHLRDPLRPLPLFKLAQHYFQIKKYDLAKKYLDEFNHSAAPSAKSLWLSIQIAAKRFDRDTALSDAMLLKQKFANSAAYQAFLKSPYVHTLVDMKKETYQHD